jgi:alcohol dehydrogenase class IV
VIAYNRDVIADKCDRLSAYLGLKTPGIDGVMEWILDLRKAFDIPHTARELGVDPDRVDEIAAAAEKDPSTGSNPKPMTAADMATVLRNALEGTLG